MNNNRKRQLQVEKLNPSLLLRWLHFKVGLIIYNQCGYAHAVWKSPVPVYVATFNRFRNTQTDIHTQGKKP